jgi:von Willebrand factor A domain-containing protein 7
LLLKITTIGAFLITTVVAQTQQQQSPAGWPCVTGRAVDPTYLELAERTGGQVFLFDRGEAGRSLVLMRESQRHKEVIFRATGTLPTGYREFKFPVDTTVESLLLTISLQCSQAISIYRPTNAELRPSEPGVEDNVYRSGRIVIQSIPEPGVWRVKLTGAGIFSVVIQARSPISFHGAEFVEAPAHLNVEQALSARLSAPLGAVVFHMVNSTGESLQQLDLKSGSESGNSREFQGSVTPAHASFRLAVEGRDASGFWYQRLYQHLFELKP